MTDYECAIIFRAAMIRQAKLLKEQRDTVLEQVAALEQRWGLGKHAPQTTGNAVVILPPAHVGETGTLSNE